VTTQPHIENADDSAAEAAFDALVCSVVEKLEAGEVVDARSVAGGDSDIEARLVQLLPALEAMVELGQSGAQRSNGHPSQFSRERDLPPMHGELGDFRILREIGRGGVGVVYEAEQITLGRRVALKVLPFAAMLGEQQLRRFKNEARAAATLKHPNIVSV
jgi:serine/threonine-protein kinase